MAVAFMGSKEGEEVKTTQGSVSPRGVFPPAARPGAEGPGDR